MKDSKKNFCESRLCNRSIESNGSQPSVPDSVNPQGQLEAYKEQISSLEERQKQIILSKMKKLDSLEREDLKSITISVEELPVFLGPEVAVLNVREKQYLTEAFNNLIGNYAVVASDLLDELGGDIRTAMVVQDALFNNFDNKFAQGTNPNSYVLELPKGLDHIEPEKLRMIMSKYEKKLVAAVLPFSTDKRLDQISAKTKQFRLDSRLNSSPGPISISNEANAGSVQLTELQSVAAKPELARVQQPSAQILSSATEELKANNDKPLAQAIYHAHLRMLGVDVRRSLQAGVLTDNPDSSQLVMQEGTPGQLVLMRILGAVEYIILKINQKKDGEQQQPDQVSGPTQTPEPTGEDPEPANEEPTSEEPTTEEPEPTSEEPATEEPTTEPEPVSQSPAEEPVSEEPATEEPDPTTEPEPIEEPATEEPTAEEPTTEEPTSEEPTTEEPTAEEPTTEEPTAEEPVSEEPASEEPTTEQPVAEEPASNEPAPELDPTVLLADWKVNPVSDSSKWVKEVFNKDELQIPRKLVTFAPGFQNFLNQNEGYSNGTSTILALDNNQVVVQVGDERWGIQCRVNKPPKADYFEEIVIAKIDGNGYDYSTSNIYESFSYANEDGTFNINKLLSCIEETKSHNDNEAEDGANMENYELPDSFMYINIIDKNDELAPYAEEEMDRFPQVLSNRYDVYKPPSDLDIEDPQVLDRLDQIVEKGQATGLSHFFINTLAHGTSRYFKEQGGVQNTAMALDPNKLLNWTKKYPECSFTFAINSCYTAGMEQVGETFQDLPNAAPGRITTIMHTKDNMYNWMQIDQETKKAYNPFNIAMLDGLMDGVANNNPKQTFGACCLDADNFVSNTQYLNPQFWSSQPGGSSTVTKGPKSSFTRAEVPSEEESSS